MTRSVQFIALLILCGSLLSPVTAQKKKPVATIFKPVGTVDYKSGDAEFVKAKPATPLAAGDIVRTQENSFAIVKFLENSIIRIQEKSEVTVSGEIAKGEFSKNVHLQRGEVGFEVKKRPNEKFEFSTPTSVASIRGTGGLLIAGQDSNDVLILGSGSVDFKNIVSNTVYKVKAGQTAYSMANGSVKVQESTPEDRRLLKKSTTDTTKKEESKPEGSNTGTDTTKTDSTAAPQESGAGVLKVGMAIAAPVAREGQALTVSVEVTEISVTLDSLKKTTPELTLYYRSKQDQPFKMLKAQFSERVTKFTIPAAEVLAPTLAVYAVMRLADATEFTTPVSSPESNPVVLPVQAGQKNELKIPFTDPSGKKRTMIIEYK
ncbi:MAG: FecR domain-containing protein [Bacteroidetes bacterium]|nr:FecR domain-containing protein [Bacteroidota bacterium]